MSRTSSARIEEAKKILSLLESDRPHTAAAEEGEEEEEEMDLYSDLSSREQVNPGAGSPGEGRNARDLYLLWSLVSNVKVSLSFQL